MPNLQNYAVIANAVAITDTINHIYRLSSVPDFTANVVRQYRRFKIYVNNTHDKNLTFAIFMPVVTKDFTTTYGLGKVYTGLISANADKIYLPFPATEPAPVSIDMINVPLLNGIFSNVIVVVKFDESPSPGGALTIGIEMQG